MRIRLFYCLASLCNVHQLKSLSFRRARWYTPAIYRNSKIAILMMRYTKDATIVIVVVQSCSWFVQLHNIYSCVIITLI